MRMTSPTRRSRELVSSLLLDSGMRMTDMKLIFNRGQSEEGHARQSQGQGSAQHRRSGHQEIRQEMNRVYGGT